jgi:SAM-dependent methyltransferase
MAIDYISQEQLARNALYENISERVNYLLKDHSSIRLLEAGCGSATYVNFKQVIESVGIDISKEQLARNAFIKEKIHGDIQTFPLPLEEFDVVICWDVLEHLPDPMMALKNFFKTLRKRGILILAFPNLLSFKGFLTKLTPFWFHNLFYRAVGYQNKPFPTCFRFSIRPDHLRKYVISNGFTIEYNLMKEGFGQKRIRNRFLAVDIFLSSLDLLIKDLTFCRLDSFLLDYCVMIFRKTR